MNDEGNLALVLIRSSFLLIPLLLTVVPWPRIDASQKAAAIVTFFWCLGMIFAWHLISAPWWRYETGQAVLAGFPVDVWIGWALAWGPVPVIWMRRWPVLVVAVFYLWIEIIVMKNASQLVTLHDGWMVGEVAGVILVLIPAVLLGRWTATKTHLGLRVLLQLVGFGAIAQLVLPIAAVAGMETSIIWSEPTRPWVLIPVGFCMAIAVYAVWQLYRAGGTPFPWDPPERLVTDGIYGFTSNPMQSFLTVAYVLGAYAYDEPALLTIPSAAIFFAIGIANWHEDAVMTERFGSAYQSYRERVPAFFFFRRRSTD